MSYYVSITTYSRIVKSTTIHFLVSCYSYPAFWNVNYLAISSSTYFFTVFSATVLSSFAIGTVFISSYSAWGSWIKKFVSTFQKQKKNYSNLAAWKLASLEETCFTLIQYINHNSYYYIIPQCLFLFFM